MLKGESFNKLKGLNKKRERLESLTAVLGILAFISMTIIWGCLSDDLFGSDAFTVAGIILGIAIGLITVTLHRLESYKKICLHIEEFTKDLAKQGYKNEQNLILEFISILCNKNFTNKHLVSMELCFSALCEVYESQKLIQKDDLFSGNVSTLTQMNNTFDSTISNKTLSDYKQTTQKLRKDLEQRQSKLSTLKKDLEKIHEAKMKLLTERLSIVEKVKLYPKYCEHTNAIIKDTFNADTFITNAGNFVENEKKHKAIKDQFKEDIKTI